MGEIKNTKTQMGHTLLKISRILLLTLIIQVNIVDGAPSENITFVTTGSSFSPIISVTGNPTIEWKFGDGSTSNSPSPTINFGSAGTRANTLVVTPWNAVTKINIGYDGLDEGVTPSPSTIAYLAQQNVISVSGLENVAPSLEVWASSYNPITSLDFSNFTSLQTVECVYCTRLSNITLRNVPSLTRLCFERSNISYLDVSEASSLADLRGARQGGPTYTINWGNTGANIWHICTRDNPQMTSTFSYSQLPVLRELFNWNDNQTGTLHLTSTSLDEVLSANNRYTAAVLSGCFPAGSNGYVKIENNNLKSIDISNDPGLFYLNASRNYLNQTEVDDVLQTLDSFNTRGGYLDLTGNSAPSDIGKMYANNLTSRQWNVQVSPKNNQPTANFTSNVISGNVPLTVQFNDTSINNPTTWSWDFGDETYSTEEFPTHVYTSPGSYTVTLGVRNPSGSDSKDVVITVLEQPVLPMANFSCSATESYVPLDVQFYDLSEHTAERCWNFGDGINSTELNPKHTYSIVGSYIANLTVSNANGTDSKTATISVLQAATSGNDGSSDGSNDGSSRGGSSSGGGAGGSPEPQNNVEIKELSQTFITSGQPVKFEFPQKATAVISIGFDSKKTVGKTTTIVEILKNQSTLVSSVPSDEVYKYLNIWVGNGGYATDKNIGNAVVTFKVPKSWVQDKKIDKSSITLNRYSENTWNKLTTSLSNEDDSYLYFTTPAPGFSPFVISGKMTTSETGIQPITGIKTPIDLSNGSTASNTKQTPDQTSHLNTSEKENTKTPAFEISLGIICLIFAFWYKRR